MSKLIIVSFIYLMIGCNNPKNESYSNKEKSIKDDLIGKYYKIEKYDSSDTLFKYFEFTDSNFYSVRKNETIVDKYMIDMNNIVIFRTFFNDGKEDLYKIVLEQLNDSTLIHKSSGIKYYKFR